MAIDGESRGGKRANMVVYCGDGGVVVEVEEVLSVALMVEACRLLS